MASACQLAPGTIVPQEPLATKDGQPPALVSVRGKLQREEMLGYVRFAYEMLCVASRTPGAHGRGAEPSM
jgi:hypothetical protein